MRTTLTASALMLAGVLAGVLAGPAPSAHAQVVFSNLSNNGFFTPFSANTAPGTRFGDSGWLTPPGAAPTTLTEITLGLVVAGGSLAGSTDIVFTFNDGDPSGLVFGPGTTLYSTTISNVALPASPVTGGPAFFNLTIPLPGVVTSGNFNNIGWSVGVENFAYAGQFGFQCSTASGQTAGFYTNNASSFVPGSGWNLFSFGSDPNRGVANFVATVSIPSPGAVGLLGVAALAAARRRRRR
jgi:MYXO-CTERM domain-containing protein